MPNSIVPSSKHMKRIKFLNHKWSDRNYWIPVYIVSLTEESDFEQVSYVGPAYDIIYLLSL